jgi:hypothetical protein
MANRQDRATALDLYGKLDKLGGVELRARCAGKPLVVTCGSLTSAIEQLPLRRRARRPRLVGNGDLRRSAEPRSGCDRRWSVLREALRVTGEAPRIA